MNDISKYIVAIFDENNNEIQFSSLCVKLYKSFRSSIESKILFIDDIPITGSKRNTYKVKFKCNCNNYSIVALKYFLSKNIIQCNKCDQNKRVKQKTIVSKKSFDSYSSEFQDSYWERHLHSEEFFNFINKIKSINHKEFNKETIIYYEHLSSNNQSKFQSFISFDNGLTKESLKSVEFICDVCGNEVSAHPFNLRRQNSENMLCRHCKFNNLKFPIKKYNDSLTYQSLPELKFIELCFENNIQILNGFEIPYHFNGKDRTYISDFYLPEFKYIIEIKGENQFYKNDLESGRIKSKEEGAYKFGKQHGIEYKLIFDYEINDFIETLKSKNNVTILN